MNQNKRECIKYWGAPGTGKTTKLLDIVDRELANGTHPSEIVYTSFTNAAADEARDRALTRFPDFTTRDFEYFRTEHSICFHLLGLKKEQVFTGDWLKKFSEAYGKYKFTTVKRKQLEERIDEPWGEELGDRCEFFASFMSNTMLPFNEAFHRFSQMNPTSDLTAGQALDYLDKRTRFKQENNLVDFADMLTAVLEQELFPPVKVLIADEMQDSSVLLYRLVEMWSERCERVYIAGDPLQAIFGFAGASPNLFFDFPAKQEILNHSHRLTPEVKNIAEQIIRSVGLPFPEFSTDGKHGHVSIRPFASIDWDTVRPAFVLARTKWLLSKLRDELMLKGIPFTIERGPQSPLVTTKGQAYKCALRLAQNSYASSAELKALMKHTGKPWVKHGGKTYISRLPEGLYYLSKLGDVFEDRFADAIKENPAAPLYILPSERTYLNRVFSRGGWEALDRAGDIVLTTIHGSKGRECRTVVISSEMTWRVFESYLRDKIPEHLCFYVGVTRAIENLIILAPEGRFVFPMPR